MERDVKRLVEAGFDRIAQQYLAWTKKADSPRGRYLQEILDYLPAEGAEVLDLGCGAGIPCAETLALHAHVTGVDISAAQIALAQQHVPEATFLQADMMAVDFPPDSFDAVVALYSVIHLPRIEQGALLTRVARWLRPHGQLLVNVGISNDPGFIDPDWLGAPMYWSSYDEQTYLDLIRRAGFSVRSADRVSEDEDAQTVEFSWIRAEKDSAPHLQAGELARLADVMRIRPLAFACRRYRHTITSGQSPDGAEWWWPGDELIQAIVARACAAS